MGNYSVKNSENHRKIVSNESPPVVGKSFFQKRIPSTACKKRSVRQILDTNGAEDEAHPLVKPTLNLLNDTKNISKVTSNFCDGLKDELQEHECLVNEQRAIV